MNRIYRLIWNELSRAWVAVAEIARGRGKRSSATAGQAPRLKFHLQILAASLALMGAPVWALEAGALPSGGRVVAGSASISQAANVLTVQQASQRAALDWQSFNIGAAASVNFVQPNSRAVALNRIVGNDASQIYGKLNANGQVFFSNPNGMLFARGAQVNVGGILATTMSLTNEDFMAGNYRFTNSGSGSIRNEGLIKALGSAALIGNNVSNAGQIVATTVTLAAGNTVAVDLTGDGLIRARVEDAALKASIENSGSIEATLAVTMTAGQAKGMLDRVVNNSGVIRATGLTVKGGEIVLEGGLLDNAGQLRADNASGNGGSIAIAATNFAQTGAISATGAGAGGTVAIELGRRMIQTDGASIDASGATQSGTVAIATGLGDEGGAFLSGRIAANATQGAGGDIAVTGRDLHFAAARIEANGATDGGNIRLGGDYQGKNSDIANAWTNSLNSSTRIGASGTSGHGGRVIIWSDSQTTFGGNIEAKGSTQGNGGFVEVSGKERLHFAGTVVAKTLLLDPKNIVIDAAGSLASFQLVDPDPGASNKFGTVVAEVDSSNIAVTAPGDSFNASASGAVYLFNSNSGALIGALRGSQANDQVGSNGVSALANGNYVVASGYWDNGGVVDAGAVTLVNGATGLAKANGSGIVSIANSLVGSTASDRVGYAPFYSSVYALSNGNYVVITPLWDNGSIVNTGAVTLVDGATGLAKADGSGIVSAVNSLVGGSANDRVGIRGMAILANGDYVVSSSYWDNGSIVDVGAVTLVDGATGLAKADGSGIVSATNSLVGSTASDGVGGSGVYALANGDYVVASVTWDDGATLDVGAVTLVDGGTGRAKADGSGVVSAANSLVGSTASDGVGGRGVNALSNGNYVVGSYLWDNGATADVGAVTLVDGSTGRAKANNSFVVSAANSLVGSTAGDQVGYAGVFTLANGNYVAASHLWDNGASVDVGAVTLVDGATGLAKANGSGVVSAANSLVGSTANDQVGIGRLSALGNGNYVVSSYNWDNGGIADVGAVTLVDGSTGLAKSNGSGVVSTANSLVGSTAGDQVGGQGATVLANGDYVVRSYRWNNGATVGAGAVTLVDGATGRAKANGSGVVSAANSLVGSTANDLLGGNGVYALANGNYVVASSNWDNGATVDAGRVDVMSGDGVSLLQGFTNFPSATATIAPGALTANLNAGTAVVLKANNDITVNSVIATSADGAGGALTLQAGRSILVNANITTDNGNFTAIANETLANGVVDAYRDAGAAAITMAGGTTINAGSGTIVLAISDGAGLTYNTAGTVTLGSLTANRWLVYAANPASVVKNGLTSGFRQYSTGYGGTIDTASGNGFIYASAPGALSVDTTLDSGTASHLYGDTPSASFGYALSGFADNEDNAGNIGLTGSAIYTAPTATTNVGSYTVGYTSGLSSAIGYTLTAGAGVAGYAVTPATLTLTADNQSRIYGDANPTLSYTPSGFKLSDTASLITTAPTLATTAVATSNVGSAPISVTGGNAGSNYSLAYVNGSLAITSAPLTVTAASTTRLYGDANPTFTGSITGFKNSETSTVLTAQPGYSTAATLASNVGSYAIVGAGGTAQNYSFSYLDGTLAITPAPLTVTAANTSRTYGDANPAFTGSIAGFVNGETIGVLTATPTYGTAATLTSNVGSYAIVGAGGTAQNYSFSYLNGSLGITARPLTVTANAQTKTYGDADPALSYAIGATAAGTGLVNGDALSGGLNRVAGETVAAGPYAINQGSLAATSNYALTYAGADLAITPATLTLTADAKTRIYGEANPILTGSIAGFKNGETVSVLTAQPTYSTPATLASNVGSYQIVGAGGMAMNYSFSYLNGSLSITPAPLTVTAASQSRTYGDANPTFTGSIAGFVNGETAGVLTVTPTYGTAATLASNVGSYAIVGTGGTATNYSFSYVNGTFGITARPLTATANAQSKTYGDADPALNYVVGATASGTGLVNGDVLSGSLSRVAGETVVVGPYAINQGSLAATSNYTLTYTGADLAITPAPLTLTADAKTRLYGDANPTLTYTPSGFKLSDTASLITTAPTLVTTAAATSNVGTVPIAVTGGAAGSNYTLAYVDGSLAITPAPLTVTAASQSRTYGDANPILTGSIDGFKNGETGTVLTTQPGYVTSAAITSNVGSYAITGSGAAAPNYSFSYVDGTLSIGQRPLTVTADAQTKVYGSPDPALTYAVGASGSGVGLVNGDSLSGALARVAGETVAGDPYAITQGGLTASSNYSLSFTGNTFAITAVPAPPPPTVDQCVASPSVAGCSTVLPTLATCTTDPTVAGCTIVLPPAVTQPVTNQVVTATQAAIQSITSSVSQSAVQTVTQAVPQVVAPTPSPTVAPAENSASSGDSSSTGSSTSATTTVSSSAPATQKASSTSSGDSTSSDKPDDKAAAKPVVQTLTIANTTVQKPADQVVQVAQAKGRMLVCR